MLSKSKQHGERAKITWAGHFCLMEKPGEANKPMKASLLKHSCLTTPGHGP